MTKVKAFFLWVMGGVNSFIASHKTLAHFFVLFWTTFLTSWGTKTSIPLNNVGINYTLDAGTLVSQLQSHLHVPTAIIAALTFGLNVIVAYASFKKVEDGTK